MSNIMNADQYIRVGDKLYKLNGGDTSELEQKVDALDAKVDEQKFPEVVLTTPVENGVVFTDEENAALSAALQTGKPVIVKCTLIETPDVVMVMNNFAGEVFVAVYANYNYLLMFDGEGWSSFVEEMRLLPEVTADDDGKVPKVVGGAWVLGDDENTVTWEEVKYKPFHKEDREVTVIREDKQYFNLSIRSSGNWLDKVSHNTPTLAELLGGEIKTLVAVWVSADGDTPEWSIKTITNDMVYYHEEGKLLVFKYNAGYNNNYKWLVICYEEKVVHEGTTYPEPGIYFFNHGVSELYTQHLTYTGKIDVLDDQCTPENIVGLPKVTTSDNGKFLQVVDGAYALVSLQDVSEEGA